MSAFVLINHNFVVNTSKLENVPLTFSAIKRDAYLKNKKCSLFQARAPFSEVLIVGTHVDLLPKNNRQARADALKHSIVKKYLDNQGFPKIVGNIMVSPVTGENIPELKEMIYSKALKVKDNGENIIGRRVSWTRKSPPPLPPILLFHYDNICSLGSKQITHMISACMSHFFLRTLITDFFSFFGYENKYYAYCNLVLSRREIWVREYPHREISPLLYMYLKSRA